MVGIRVGILGSGVGKGMLVPSGITKVGGEDRPSVGSTYISFVGVADWIGIGKLVGNGVALDFGVTCGVCPQADNNTLKVRMSFVLNDFFIN